jgi:hypothetical protein
MTPRDSANGSGIVTIRKRVWIRRGGRAFTPRNLSSAPPRMDPRRPAFLQQRRISTRYLICPEWMTSSAFASSPSLSEANRGGTVSAPASEHR